MIMKIKKGSKVERKSKYYQGITGVVLSTKNEKALVQWNSSTGSREDAKIKTTVSFKKIRMV